MKQSSATAELTRLRRALEASPMMTTLLRITELCRTAGLSHMADTLTEQTALYRSMLQYLEASMTDPERPVHIRAIKRLAYRALDLLDHSGRKPADISGYFSTARMVGLRGSDPLALLRRAAVAAREGNLDPGLNSEVFDALWVTPLLSETADPQRLSKLITQLLDTIPSPENTGQADRRALALLVTTSLTLGTLQYFDSDKLLLLIHAAGSDDVALAARALAGVFLVAATHPSRVTMEKEAADALTILADRPSMCAALQDTMMLVARTRDTDRVTAKISNEIMPRLTEIQSDMRRRFADIQAMADMTAEDLNPQWEELLADSKITRPLEEMTEMQSNGEDVMMAAFARLKDFSIFRTAAGWFTPFYLTHADLTAFLDDNDAPLLKGLCEAQTMLCDSDKYSIALSLNRIPKATRRMMNAQLESQLEALRQQKDDSLAEELKSPLHTETMLYLRGMMRFFRLFHAREGLVDPFLFPRPESLGPLSRFLSTKENHDNLGRFYFKNGYWEEAIGQLVAAIANTPSGQSSRILSMIGYAHQRLNRLEKALEYYDKASMTTTSADPWLLRKLAWVNRKLGHHQQAAGYYKELLHGDSDNPELNTLLANALYDAGDYQGALKLYYKVEFLATDGRRTLRPVAWCELLTGQADKARQTYRRLLTIEDTGNPDLTTADVMNAGHVEFVSARYEEAYRLYAKGLDMVRSNAWKRLEKNHGPVSATVSTDKVADYLQSLRADIPVLTRLTSDSDTPARMAMMLDRLSL